MKRNKGFTLIELIIVIVIAFIGMMGISFILINAYNDLKESQQIKRLQEDMHLACYTIKSFMEEANEFLIDTETDSNIDIRYTDKDSAVVWEKKIYKDGSNLVLEDIKNENSEIVIDTLSGLL